MFVADFRSDTVTRPCAEMRRVMADADVGDDVFGDDPTVNALQEKAAEFFGVEAALFVPSGTMANQIAIKLLTRPGDEVLCGEISHVFLNEGGALGLISGVQTRTFRHEADQMKVEEIVGCIREPDIHHPRTAVLALENTHNYAGGRIVPPELLARIARSVRALGVSLFLDGARLLNAAVASGVAPRAYTASVDLTSTCLSKGLGCPVGSLLLGSRAGIEEGRRIRKALGGGMRQAGVLAAAGLFALEHRVERLAEDHRRAHQLAEWLAEAPGWSVDPAVVQTNIVLAHRPARDAHEVVEALRREGIGSTALDAGRVRFVTHLDVDDACLDSARRALSGLPARLERPMDMPGTAAATPSSPRSTGAISEIP